MTFKKKGSCLPDQEIIRDDNEKEKGAPRVRITLDLTGELNQKLESLADGEGATKAAILRKAIALMQIAVDAKAEGKQLAIIDENQSGERVHTT